VSPPAKLWGRIPFFPSFFMWHESEQIQMEKTFSMEFRRRIFNEAESAAYFTVVRKHKIDTSSIVNEGGIDELNDTIETIEEFLYAKTR